MYTRMQELVYMQTYASYINIYRNQNQNIALIKFMVLIKKSNEKMCVCACVYVCVYVCLCGYVYEESEFSVV